IVLVAAQSFQSPESEQALRGHSSPTVPSIDPSGRGDRAQLIARTQQPPDTLVAEVTDANFGVPLQNQAVPHSERPGAQRIPARRLERDLIPLLDSCERSELGSITEQISRGIDRHRILPFHAPAD